jgi:diguanylate cyclase (GGDEF)-like protein/PAS domain S-box-containing protein
MTQNPLDPYTAPAQRGALDRAALLEAVVSGGSDAIMAMDPQGKIILWNAACEAMHGWTEQEMLGQSIEVLLPEDRRPELSRLVRTMTGRAEPAAVETIRLHRSGELIPVSCRLSPLVDRQGHVVGVSAVVRDNGRELELREALEVTRQLAEARFAQSVVAQATLSPDGVLVEVNPALCRLSGYEQNRLLGRSVMEFMAEPERRTAETGLAALVSGELGSSQHSRLMRHADGRYIETRVSIFPIRDLTSGAVLRLEAVVEDLSATAAAERELLLREARWQSLVEHSADVALFCGPDAELLFVSASALSRFGYQPSDVVGADGFSFIHPDDEPGVRAAWAATAAAELGTQEIFDVRVRHTDGSWRWCEESLTNRLADPAVAAMVVNLVDITERKAAEAVIEELAGTDALTGLATRAPLMAALDAAFAAGHGERTAIAVLDLARFKLVNDVYGHRTGDDVLAEVGVRLSRHVSDRGVVARLGADRFAVLLREVADVSQVFELGSELLDALAQPFVVGDDGPSLTAVIGAALGPAVDSGALLTAAESAVAAAKQGIAGPMHVVRAESATASLSRARLIEDLRRGLQQDQLVVHFQPVLSVADGRPVAAEALVRWNHPDKGVLSPGAFIDVAEETGLIVEIGQKVLEQACQAAARWASAGGDAAPFQVAVNLSAKQLTGSGVVDVVRQALASSGASPAQLMLEVTESAVMSDVDVAATTLHELRDLGVEIAVDDFGTGYSSLTYLKQFPVTTLKIDRSFVSGLGTDNDDAAIVASVISLARAMGLECIAEGVETEQQRLILQALGCPYGQGYLWSPAVDAATFETWLGDAAVDSAQRRPRSRRASGRTGTRSVRGGAAQPHSPEVLARATELSRAGASLRTIAAALNADQLLTHEGRRWSARSVSLLLDVQSRR